MCAHDDKIGAVVARTSLQAFGDIVGHAVDFKQLGVTVDLHGRHRLRGLAERREVQVAEGVVHRGHVVVARIGENGRLLNQINRMHLSVTERCDPCRLVQIPLRRFTAIDRDENLPIHEMSPTRTVGFGSCLESVRLQLGRHRTHCRPICGPTVPTLRTAGGTAFIAYACRR